MSNLLLELERLKKSRLIVILLISPFLLSLFFFFYQFYAVNQVRQANIEKIEFEINFRERSIELGEDYNGLDELNEDFVKFSLGRVKSDANQIPYLEKTLEMYLEGTFEDYLEARMTFIEVASREEDEFVDLSWLMSEEDYRAHQENRQGNILPFNTHHPLLEEYEQLLVYQSLEEPIEDEQASVVLPNHFILLGKALLFPLGLSFIIILSSLLMLEDRTELSIRLRQVETGSTVRYYLSVSLFALGYFLVFILSTYLWSGLLVSLFGQPLFDVAPSWQAPVLMQGKIIEGMSSINIFVLILVILFVSYLFFFIVFQLFSQVIKQLILSVVSFIVFVTFGYYLADTWSFLKQWFNPFQLFYFEDLLVNGQYLSIYGRLIATLGWTILGFLLVSRENARGV